MRFDRENSNHRHSQSETHLTGAKVVDSKKRKLVSFSLWLAILTAVIIPQTTMPAYAGHGGGGGGHGGGGGGGHGGGGGAHVGGGGGGHFGGGAPARAMHVQQRAFRQPKAPKAARQPNPVKQSRHVAYAQRHADHHAEKSVRHVTHIDNRQAHHQSIVQKHTDNKAQKHAFVDANKNAKALRKQEHAAHTATAKANKFIAHAQSRDFKIDKHVAKAQFKNANIYQRGVIKAGRWDAKLDNRSRYRAYRNYRKNWGAQRTYLHANLSRFNQLAAINQAQQIQLANQMQAAYLAYHNNNYNGAYNWNVYSNPQFLDYLQYKKPSLLQQVLSALGLGYSDDYLYSPNWDFERNQLAQNLANIHQLVLEGRITPMQEQVLINQMQPQYLAYNSQFSGVPTWSQYSDPGFIDYLHTRRPTILTSVRDCLIR